MDKQAFTDGYMHKQAVSPSLVRRGLKAAGGYLKDPLGRGAGKAAVARFQEGADAARQLNSAKGVQAPLKALREAKSEQSYRAARSAKEKASALKSQQTRAREDISRTQKAIGEHTNFMNTPQTSQIMEDSKKNIGLLLSKKLGWDLEDATKLLNSPASATAASQKALGRANKGVSEATSNAFKNYDANAAAKLKRTDESTMGEVSKLFRKKDTHQDITRAAAAGAGAGAVGAGVHKVRDSKPAKKEAVGTLPTARKFLKGK